MRKGAKSHWNPKGPKYFFSWSTSAALIQELLGMIQTVTFNLQSHQCTHRKELWKGQVLESDISLSFNKYLLLTLLYVKNCYYDAENTSVNKTDKHP